MSGYTINFSAPGSGAKATFNSNSTSNGTTNATGYASPSNTPKAGQTARTYNVTATISGTSFNTTFALTNTPGAASTIAIVSGNGQSAALGANFAAPLVTVVKDTYSNVVPNVSVTFGAPSSGASLDFASSATVTTDSAGKATSPTISAKTATGTYSITAKVNNSTPSLPTAFSLTNTAAAPARVGIEGGSGQTTQIGSDFTNALKAKVTDTLGNVVSGVTVTFTLPASGASGTFTGSSTTTTTAVTGSDGIATSSTVHANTASGTFYAQASVAGIASPGLFTLTNTPGAPVAISVYQGTPQYTVVSSSFATPLMALVKDSYNNPVPNASVTFLAPTVGSAATFPGPANQVVVTTDASGYATAPTVMANTTRGSYSITASIVTGAYVNFNLTNSPAPASIVVSGGSVQSTRIGTAFGTSLTAIVKDNLNIPVQGALVRFSVPSSGSSAVLSSTTALTNAQGVATVTATANSVVGTYSATGTVSGVSSGANFTLTNTVGLPAAIVATGGLKQSTLISTAFSLPLAVTVTDSGGNPVPNVDVTFSVPGSGASATLSYLTVKTNSSGMAQVSATANATDGNYAVTAAVSGVAGTASFDLTNTIDPEAILVVSKSAPSPALNIGADSTYTLTVTNAGTAETPTAKVLDQLPTGLTFVSASGTDWACTQSSGLVTCEFTGTSISSGGGTSTISVVVTPNTGTGGQSVINYASVDPTGGSSPPTPGADCTPSTSCAANTASISADPVLGIAKSAPSPGLAVGANSTYTLTVTNSGSGNATTAQVLDLLPTGISLVSATGTHWACSTNGSLITCDFSGSTIAYSGGTSTILVEVTPDASLGGQSVTNYASIDPTGGGSPPTPGSACTPSADCTSNTANVTGTPSIKGTKTAVITGGTSATEVGDVVTYTIHVTNTGDLNLTDVGIQSDTLTRLDTAATAVTSFGASAFHTTGNALTTSLAPAASADFTATYTITQADIDAGGLSNTATVQGTSATGDVTDVTDDGDDTDGNIADDATQSPVTVAPQITGVKTSVLTDTDASGTLSAGDTLTYTVTATNTGNVTPSDVAVDTDTLTQADATASANALSSFVIATNGVTTLAPDASVSFTATYLVAQADIDAGGLSNTATAIGSPPVGVDVTDVTDDGDDTDTNTTDDATEDLVTAAPQITGVKTSVLTDTDASGTLSAGDTLTYTVTATNAGNVTLSDVAVDSDTLTQADTTASANALSSFVIATNGVTTLAPDASVSFTATYLVAQADIDAGGLSNTATAIGSPPVGVDVTDVTDDGDDTDTNTTDDATEDLVTAAPQITIKKTVDASSLLDGVRAGDVLVYTIVIKNTGNVTLSDLNLTDTPTDLANTPLVLTTPPVLPRTTLQVGEEWTVQATYALTQATISAGGVQNIAKIEAKAPDGAGIFAESTVVGNASDVGEGAPTDVGFPGEISGTVKSYLAGAEGIEVYLLKETTPGSGNFDYVYDGENRLFRVTDRDGNYVFLNVPPANYGLEFRDPNEDATIAASTPDANAAGNRISGISVGAGAVEIHQDARFIDPSGVVYDSETFVPIAGAKVTLLFNGSPVPNSWLNTEIGQSNGTLTGVDGIYSYFFDPTTAASGIYTLEVQKSGYTVSDTVVAATGPYKSQLGGALEKIVPADQPAPDVAQLYYMTFDFSFTNDAETTSNGVANNHIPMDANLADDVKDDVVNILTDDLKATMIQHSQRMQGYAADALAKLKSQGDLTCRARLDRVLSQQPIQFADGGAVILPESLAILNKIAKILRTCDTQQFAIVDTLAQSNAATGLSDLRARAVRSALISRGVDAQILITGQAYDGATSRGSGQANAPEIAIVQMDSGIVGDTCKNTALNDHDVSINAKDNTGDMNGNFSHETHDCATGTWRIVSADGSFVRTQSGIDQMMLDMSLRRERSVGHNRIAGRFIDAYASQSDVTSLGTGTIKGFGLDGGFVGETAFDGGMFLDWDLGAAIGNHTFDLDFNRSVGVVNATGDYTYGAVFAGAALSGEMRLNAVKVSPRAGFDVAWSPGGQGNIQAVRGQVEQSETLTIPEVLGLRAFSEMRVEGGATSAPINLAVTPRLLCDFGFDGVAMGCGYGGSLELKGNGKKGRSFSISVDGSRVQDTVTGAIGLHYALPVEKGSLSGEVSADSAGKAIGTLDYTVHF